LIGCGCSCLTKSFSCRTQQFYEAIVGTLKAARKKGIIDFKGGILLKGAHDDVDITLLVEPEESEE